MGEVSKISKETLIPIGLVIVLVCSIWVLAQISHQVTVNKDNIVVLQSDIKEVPTRTEYEDMKDTIKEIRDYLLGSEKKN